MNLNSNVRLVKSNGETQILSYSEASKLAEEEDLDLICVSEKGDMPVFKILDKSKFLYEQKKKEKEQKRKQKALIKQTKEIKIKPKIFEHDLEIKCKMIEKFLEDGNNVKVSIIIKGREFTHLDIPKNIATNIINKFENVIASKPYPKLDGSNINFLLEPKK